MTRALSLTALLVDDMESIALLYRALLEKIDISLDDYPNNEQAYRAIDETVRLGLPLHLIITDLGRPGGPLGLSFIEKIRTAAYSKTVGGGLRLRYLPLIVISGNARYYVEQIRRIDAAIPVLEKPVSPDGLVEVVIEALSAYRSKILSELQHLGIAVVWKEGLYRVFPAYEATNPELMETERFAGISSTFASSYTTLCLIQDQGAIARFYLDEFERLLNSPHANERDMQAFFERHPEFILGGHFDSYWSQPSLPTADLRIVRPDFVLQPVGLRSTAWNWQVLDLKSPQAPLMVNSQFHRSLSHHVSKVVTQLRDYGEYFADPRHQETLRQRFGGVVPQPKLVGLIGRLPSQDARERYTVLRTRLTDVALTTYDEILEFRRARVEQIEATLSKGTGRK